MNSRTTALIAAFLVQLLYGLNYTFAKTVMNQGFVKPYALVILRVLGALILFWLLGLFMPKQKVDKKDFITFFVAAIFGVAINMILFLKGPRIYNTYSCFCHSYNYTNSYSFIISLLFKRTDNTT